MRIRTIILVLVSITTVFGACNAQPSTQESTEISTPGEQPSTSEEKLPKPILTDNSVEICLNSRYSDHSLFGTANNQQIANVLWAAGIAPVTGTSRNIYITTTTGEYLYNPDTHSLSKRSDQQVTGGAFVIDCESNLPIDTGIAYMLATLSSVSLWKSSEPAVANCPKQTSLYFGVQNVKGLTSELAAHSSLKQGDPGWLPDPSTNGQNKLEEVLADLNYVNKFSSKNLTLQQISQLLWAGYGCTPHVTANGRMGLTVPSAMANYYLTGKIYLVNENGIHRYHNRNPSTDLTTRDHRLETINSGDKRHNLQAAVSGLPEAPCYIVVCHGEIGAGIAQDQNWALLEIGFVAANILVQASAIDLGCYFNTALTPDEQAAIQKTTGIPSTDIPQLIISIGVAR
jgi:hypothetical protein